MSIRLSDYIQSRARWSTSASGLTASQARRLFTPIAAIRRSRHCSRSERPRALLLGVAVAEVGPKGSTLVRLNRRRHQPRGHDA